MVNNNEQQSGRLFERRIIDTTPTNIQQYGEPYGGVFPSESTDVVILNSYDEIEYQIVSQSDDSVFDTFANLLDAENWLKERGY